MSDKNNELPTTETSDVEFVYKNQKQADEINKTLITGRIAVITGEPGIGKTLMVETYFKNHVLIKPMECDNHGRYILSTDELNGDKNTVLVIDDAFLFNKETLKLFSEYAYGKNIKLIITSLSPEDMPGMEHIADYIRLERAPVTEFSTDNNKRPTYH